MKAILLAAGLGTRLKPITNTIPKCLVPVKGQPLLGLWIKKLIDLGVSEILINTHYFAEQVEKYVASSPYKHKIKLVNETELLGTGGTLVTNQNFWKNHETLVVHADNYCEDSLDGLILAHRSRPKCCVITALLFNTDTPKQCGIVELSNIGVIKAFHEKVKNPPGNLASGALFIFDENVFSHYFSMFKRDRFYEVSVDMIPKLVGSMFSYITTSKYIDIGTIEAYNSVK